MGEEDARTLWVGQLLDKVSEEILYELFLQAGPLEKVKKPKGKNYAFITFNHDASVPYAMELMRGVTLFGQNIKMQYRGGKSGAGTSICGSPNDRMDPSALQRSYSAPNFPHQNLGPGLIPNMNLMQSPQLPCGHFQQQGSFGAHGQDARFNRDSPYQGTMFDTPGGHPQGNAQNVNQLQNVQLQMDIQRQLASLASMNSPQLSFQQGQGASPWQRQQGYQGHY